MSDQFVAEIRAFPFNFAPVGWAQCNGQIISISQNTAVFSLLGTNFGGNGVSNFQLPNLQGSFPLAYGQGAGLTNRDIGEVGGSPTVALTVSELPAHSHTVVCAGAGNTDSPAGALFADSSAAAYGPPGTGTVNMRPTIVSSAGANQPHNNMPPYLALNFCIALEGIFPPRS
jgi:microcystin-dependent protein